MKQIGLFFVALALASPLTLAGPAVPALDARLEASDCGDYDGLLCKTVETCWKAGGYSRCTTDYSYYTSKESLEDTV